MGEKSLSFALAGLLLVLTGLLAIGTAPAGAVSRAGEEMSEQRAGQYYMRTYCAYSPALARFNEAVFQGKDEVSAAEIRRRLPVLKREAGRFASAVYRHARGLLNPPKAWPSSVAGKVETVADRLLEMHASAERMEAASTAQGFIEHYNKTLKAARAGVRPAAVIRARLDLPAPGRGC